jgi:hypothetical protein
MGGRGLPKVSSGLAIPDPSMPCGRATPETNFQLFLGWPTYRAGGLRLSSTLLVIPRHMPMALYQMIVVRDTYGNLQNIVPKLFNQNKIVLKRGRIVRTIDSSGHLLAIFSIHVSV